MMRLVYLSKSDRSSVSVDFEAGRVMLASRGVQRTYAFAQLLDAEIVEDGHGISKTNRGSQLMGAAIGAAALGGAGALIGGLSASKTTQQRVSRIALNIIVQDQGCPLHAITFLDAGSRGADPETAARNRRVAEGVRAQLMNAKSQAGSHSAVAAPAPAAGAIAAPPQAPAPSPAVMAALAYSGTSDRKLILICIGTRKAHVEDIIKREVPECSYERRQDLINYGFTPTVLMTNVPEERARRVHDALAAVGAILRIGQVRFP